MTLALKNKWVACKLHPSADLVFSSLHPSLLVPSTGLAGEELERDDAIHVASTTLSEGLESSILRTWGVPSYELCFQYVGCDVDWNNGTGEEEAKLSLLKFSLSTVFQI